MSNLLEFIKTDFSFEDDRGYLHQLCREGYKQVNVSFSKADVFRGGHYHKENIESFFVIDGEIAISLSNGTEQLDVIVKAGDFFTIKPYALHSFTFVKDTTMIAMYDKGVEKEDGTKDIHVGEK